MSADLPRIPVITATGASMRIVLLFVAACLAALPTHAAVDALYVIPTESRIDRPLAPGTQLVLELHSVDAPALSKVLGVPGPVRPGDPLRYRLGDYPSLPSTDGIQWLGSTFVIDYSEPSVSALYQEFQRERLDRPIHKRLIEFVANRVRDEHGKGFEFASEVATDLAGDCTEHSVLLAALARRAGIPARVVLGIAVIEEEQGFGAFGHAWVEMLVDGAWTQADAALHTEPGQPNPLRGYVRHGVLSNEGPGFAMAMAPLFQVWLQRVVVVAEPSPVAAQ